METLKSKELRIGNLHETDCFSHPRMGISPIKINNKCFSAITSYGIYLVDEGKLDFKPIPLAEEWLVKLGFVIDDNDSGYDQSNPNRGKQVYRNGIAVINDSGKFKLRVFCDDDGWYSFNWTEIKNVHQLQNLYFALTGKELELK